MKRLILLLVILMVFVSPAFAQDGLTVTAPDNGDITLSLFEFFGVVASGLLVGGVTMGSALILILRALLKSPALVSYIERAFDSQPSERKEPIRATVDFLKEVTDGIPLESKTPNS